MAAHEARLLQKGDALFVVLDPSYRGIGVVGSGSGRHVSPRVAVRARRMALEMFPGKRKPRAAASSTPARGRTSRKPKKPRWR